jgi:uncharacterized protein (TIGR03435 family)
MLMQLGGGQIGGQGFLLEVLVKQLSTQLGQVVQDKTGLTGDYDFNLRWAPDSAQTPVLTSAGGEQHGIGHGLHIRVLRAFALYST